MHATEDKLVNDTDIIVDLLVTGTGLRNITLIEGFVHFTSNSDWTKKRIFLRFASGTNV